MKHLIIIPAYNEEHSLPQTIAALQKLPAEFELLVVNDGSTDRTQQVAEDWAAHSRLPLYVVRLATNLGIGAAVQTGYLFARRRGGYRYAIQFDADGQHNVEAIQTLVQVCERRGLDLCVGSRFLHGDPDGFRSTAMRRVGIRFFAGLISLLSRTRVTDPTSGFRCAGPRAWAAFAEYYPDDYPEPESLFWCVRNRLRVGEAPVRMFRREAGVSSIRSLRAVYYMLKVTLAILVDSLRPKEQLE